MPKHPYDRFDLYEFLKTVIERQPNGLCTFKGEWNDSRVARKYGIHRQTAARIRKSQFGPLEAPFSRKSISSDPGPPAGVAAAVSGFEHRLAKLEGTSWDHGFTDRVTALEKRMEAFEISIDILTRRRRRAARKQKARKP